MRRYTIIALLIVGLLLVGTAATFAQEDAKPVATEEPAPAESQTESADKTTTSGDATTAAQTDEAAEDSDESATSTEGQGGGDAAEQAPSEDITYVIQRGDILDSIGAAFDVQVRCIIEQNNIPFPNRIPIGEQIIISFTCPPYDGYAPVLNPRGVGGGGPLTSFPEPAREPARSPEVREGDVTYVVQPADTLDGIGRGFNVSVSALEQANGGPFRKADFVPGMILVIPADAPAFGVTVATNPIPGVRPINYDPDFALGQGGGDPVFVPEVGPDDITYVVQRGDLLNSIAQQFNISEQAIRDANQLVGLRPARWVPGLLIVLPADAPAYGMVPALNPVAGVTPVNFDTDAPLGQGGGGSEDVFTPEIGPNDRAYVVQPGDTLDGIGQEFNISVQSLRDANQLTSLRQFVPGLLIVLPADAPAYGVVPAN